jgi:hypothetical protein
VTIEKFDGCSAGRANYISCRVLVKKFLFHMGVSAVKLTQLSPVSLQLLSVASLHLPAITANYVPLMIHHINRIESLKVSLDSLEWPAKRATNVSADMSNRCVHHRPRDIARNAALLSSTFRTAPLTITSRHEASITAKFLVEQLDLQFSLSRPIGTKSGGTWKREGVAIR